MKQDKAKNLRFKAGGWRVLLCLTALALAVGIGLLADRLPTTAKRIDITPQKMYTLSDTTKTLLKGLDGDVTILYLAQSGSEDARLRELIARYEAASEHVRFRYIGSTEAAYYTAQTLAANSVIVTNGEFVIVCDQTSLYSPVYETTGMYQQLTDYLFSAENALNQAIANVTSDLPIAYALGGHNETASGGDFIRLLGDAGMHMKTLYLAELSAIPEDAAMIVINAPQVDITEKEAELLKGYLASGGSVLLATDPKYAELANLGGVCRTLGLKWMPGVVMDTDANYLYNPEYSYYLLPDAASDDVTATLLESGNRALLSQTHAIEVSAFEGGAAKALLTSSADSFLKKDAYTDGIMTYAQGDPVGPLALAAISSNDAGGKLFWVGSAQCLTDEINEMSYGANYLLTGSAITWMHGEAQPLVEPLQSVSLMVDPPVYTQTRMTVVTVILFSLPAVLLVAGIVAAAKSRGKKKS